jgi:NitT/TauT family transport system permease protein
MSLSVPTRVAHTGWVSGRRRVRSALPGAALLMLLLALWIAVKYGANVPPQEMPAPLDVVREGWTQRGQLLSAASSTLEGALGGFLLGNAIAVLAALAVAASTLASRVLLPVALVVRTFPIIAIAPLLTLLLGYGTITIVTVAAIIIFFPTMINGVLGLRSVPPEALELMATANASRLDVLWRLRLPTALPYIFSGLQIGAATCILAAMVAEWVTTGTGLGYLILEAGTQFDVPLMWAGVLVAAAMALLVFAATGWLARRLIRGTPDAD